jgi:glutathione S-transferase
MVANQVIGLLISPTLQKHFAMLNSYVEKSPYLAGEHITGADAAMSFAIVSLKTAANLEALGKWEKGTFEETFPKLWEYMGRIEKEPAWQRSVDKITEVEGKFRILP